MATKRLKTYKLFFDLETFKFHIDKKRTYKNWLLIYTSKNRKDIIKHLALVDQNVMAFERLYTRSVTKLILFTFGLYWFFVSFLMAIPLTIITFLITNFLAHVLFRRSMNKRSLKVRLEEYADKFEDYTSYHETDHSNMDNFLAIVGGVAFLGLTLIVNIIFFGLSL